MHLNFLDILLIVFFTALLVSALFRQLRLPVILGYLLVGILMGPHTLGIVPDLPDIIRLAEFGIVLLMFTVGLEFSVSKLMALKRLVFVVGGLQVSLTMLITTAIGIILGMTPTVSLIIGSIAAMSSTAIVIKQLHDQLELHSSHGLNAIGILLFQDLAVIPIIIFIASVVDGTSAHLSMTFLWALLKGFLAILLMFGMGRWLLKPLFRMIAKTRAIELFTLMVLFVALFSAWMTNLLGLSYALGAFLAGMMLSETEFRHQIEVEIRPFRDILLGLFFITIGMQADIMHWYHAVIWIFLLLVALIIGKLVLIYIISRFFGNNSSTSLRTGLVLAQGGEFGFAILTLALQNQLLPTDYGQVILGALLISFILSPFLIYFNQQIADFFIPKSKSPYEEPALQQIFAHETPKHHVIICGYGRVGQHIGRLLDKINYPYIALDLNAELVRVARIAREKVIYGDPTHPDILKAVGIDHAKALVISFNDLEAAIKILNMVKQTHPHLATLVRCRDESELKQLKSQGASEIIAELFEESLTISHHLLNLIHIPSTKIADLLQEVRSKDYDLLYKVFIGETEEEPTIDTTLREQLMPILIPENAYAANKQLMDLQLNTLDIDVIAMRRGDAKQFKPRGNTKIFPNDILIVYGLPANLELAEKRILIG